MHQTYDDLDLLSDNEEIEIEEVEELEVNDVSEIIVNPQTFSLEIEEEKTEKDSNESVLIIDENKEEEETITVSTVPPPPTPTPVNPTPVNPTPVINNELTVVIDEVNQLTVEVENLNLDGAPLPPNLSTSPMPEPSSFVEPVVDINYKKMKVTELKKLCKSRGIKGYSKLKKKQLIELLSQ